MQIAVFLILLIVFFVYIFKVKLMHPVGIISMMWIFFIIGSLLFLQVHYQFIFKGINWILFVILFALILSIAMDNKYYIKNNKYDTLKQPNIPWSFISFLILAGFVKVLYDMIHNGISFGVFSAFNTLQDVSHQMSIQRYSGEETYTFIGQILGMFLYAAPICCGYAYIFAANKKRKLLCFSSVLPVIVSMLLTSAKLALVSYVILFFTGFYVAHIYKNKTIPSVNFKVILGGILIVSILLVLFYLSFLLRIGRGETSAYQLIIEKISIYAFGHVQGFDIWFSQKMSALDSYGLGTNTFLAVSSKLGFAEKKQGVYDLTFGSCTNVYTPFRGLIEDFGPIFGMIAYILLVALMLSCFYKLIRSMKDKWVTQVVFSVCMFYCLFFAISPWVYTSYIMAFLIFGVFLFTSFHIKVQHHIIFRWRKRGWYGNITEKD